MPRLSRIMCVTGFALILASCAQMMGSNVSPDASAASPAVSVADVSALGRAAFCDTANPIRWSALDTDDTIIAVKSHNATGKRLCGWK